MHVPKTIACAVAAIGYISQVSANTLAASKSANPCHHAGSITTALAIRQVNINKDRPKEELFDEVSRHVASNPAFSGKPYTWWTTDETSTPQSTSHAEIPLPLPLPVPIPGLRLPFGKKPPTPPGPELPPNPEWPAPPPAPESPVTPDSPISPVSEPISEPLTPLDIGPPASPESPVSPVSEPISEPFTPLDLGQPALEGVHPRPGPHHIKGDPEFDPYHELPDVRTPEVLTPDAWPQIPRERLPARLPNPVIPRPAVGHALEPNSPSSGSSRGSSLWDDIWDTATPDLGIPRIGTPGFGTPGFGGSGSASQGSSSGHAYGHSSGSEYSQPQSEHPVQGPYSPYSQGTISPRPQFAPPAQGSSDVHHLGSERPHPEFVGSDSTHPQSNSPAHWLPSVAPPISAVTSPTPTPSPTTKSVVTVTAPAPAPIRTINSPRPKQLLGNGITCDVSYQLFFDGFEIRGKNFLNAKMGHNFSNLKKHLKHCGVLTKWRFEWTPDDCCMDWRVSGNLPIWVEDCVGDALVKAGAPNKGNCH